MTPVEIIKEKILAMEQALLQNHPRMPVLLKEIHTHLKADPEIVTLLDEEDIVKIVNGLIKQTQTEVAGIIMKDKKKSLKNIGIGDL